MVSIYKELKSNLKGKVAFAGVGNILKGDDGAGVVLVNMLKDKIKNKIAFGFLDCGTTPENYLERLKDFDCVVIFDAVDFGKKSGEIAILRPAELSEAGISTHNLSLKLACRYLEESGIEVVIVGIQPESLCLNRALSKAVKSSLEEFTYKLSLLLN